MWRYQLCATCSSLHPRCLQLGNGHYSSPSILLIDFTGSQSSQLMLIGFIKQLTVQDCSSCPGIEVTMQRASYDTIRDDVKCSITVERMT
jgi:hypothetical protein